MKRLVVMIWIMLSAVSFGFAQENDSADVAQRLKALESQYKLLDDNYKNKLDYLNREFDLKAKATDIKFQKWQQAVDKQISDSKNEISDTRSLLNSWGIGTGSAIVIIMIAVYKLITSLYNSVYKYADTKAKEMFDARFAEEFEKLFKARDHAIREIIKSEDEANRLKLSKSIQVLSLPGASENLQDFFLKTGFLNVSYDAFDPNNIIANKDLILLNNDGIKIDLQNSRDIKILTDVGEYISKLPRTTIGFYFGQGIVKYPGDNFASANIRFQLYGNLINALRYQEVLKA